MGTLAATALGSICRPRGAVRVPRRRRFPRFPGAQRLGTVTCAANDRTNHNDTKRHAADGAASGRLPDQPAAQAGTAVDGLTMLSAELCTALDALVLTFAGESKTLTLAPPLVLVAH
jgi:hypothetical protein